MFWTLGPQQCGRAALAGWRDLILPSDVRLWPFDGPLETLIGEGFTVAETYPALAYRRLSLPRFAKSRQVSRAICAPTLLEWAHRTGAEIDPALAVRLTEGFPATAGADNAFDATVGLLHMLALLRGLLPMVEPERGPALMAEGWMLGLDPPTPIPPSAGSSDAARSRSRPSAG